VVVRRGWVGAACAYLALAMVVWTPAALFASGRVALGGSPSSDYQVFGWSLAYWPYAVEHGLDPLRTGLLWAPYGYSIAWVTSVPTLALLLLPVTVWAGPLAAYNVGMFVAAPAAATAAFALYRAVCGRFWPALCGGFVFGFSPYLLGQSVGQHLNLVQVWPVPLLALVAVRLDRGVVGTRRAALQFGVLWLALVGASLELAATTGVFALLCVALAGADRQLRGRVLLVAGERDA